MGALPGISPTLAVALAIPLTFNMEPVLGLSLLGALYVSTIFGGGITAILYGVPGAPANIATTFDGYPMAKMGRAVEALTSAGVASLIGAIFGACVLIALAFYEFDLSSHINYGTFFLMAILGLVLAFYEAKSISGGVVSVLLGVMAASVGYNAQGSLNYAPTPDFMGGLPVLPVLLSVFVFPQIYDFCQGAQDNRPTNITIKNGIKTGLINIINSKKYLISGTFIGTIVGVLPGIGGQISGVAAHRCARLFYKPASKPGETTGNHRGLISVESSNNAMVGPSLIPLLTMGIPGSPTAAVIGGALLMYGIFPSPDIFTNSPQALRYFIGALVASGFISALAIFIWMPAFNLINYAKPKYLASIILALSIYGISLTSSSAFDVFIFALIGIIFVLFKSSGLSSVLFILSYLLWPLIEQNWMLIQALTDQNEIINYFLLKNINFFIFIAIVISTVIPLYTRFKEVLISILILAAAAYAELDFYDSLSGLTIISLGYLVVKHNGLKNLAIEHRFELPFLAALPLFYINYTNFVYIPVFTWLAIRLSHTGIKSLFLCMSLALALIVSLNIN